MRYFWVWRRVQGGISGESVGVTIRRNRFNGNDQSCVISDIHAIFNSLLAPIKVRHLGGNVSAIYLLLVRLFFASCLKSFSIRWQIFNNYFMFRVSVWGVGGLSILDEDLVNMKEMFGALAHRDTASVSLHVCPYGQTFCSPQLCHQILQMSHWFPIFL